MRKILLATLMGFVTHSVLASHYDWRMGTSGECFVKYVDAHRVFRYCGGGQSSCAGKAQRSLADAQTLTTGMIFHDDTHKVWYVCCNATASSQGTYQALDTNKFATKGDGSIPTIKKTVTIDLEGGGRCTYEQEYDACGNTYNKVCTEPTSCTDGLILRNGKCVEPCAEGYEFERVTSNRCVECDTTMYHGPAKMEEKDLKTKLTDARIFLNDDGSGEVDPTRTGNAAKVQADQSYCLKCDKDTEFYDKETKTCISKAGMLKGTAQEMSQCGLCVNNLVMANCIKCFAAIDEVADSSFTACQTKFKEVCFFPE